MARQATTHAGSLVADILGRLRPDATASPLVLRVGLAFRERRAELRFGLGLLGGEGGFLGPWQFSGAELGVPANLTTPEPPPLSLPTRLVDLLAQGSRQLGAPDGRPLWLDLLRPCGFLGALAWERELVGALHRPILRLSNLFEWPQESPDMADVALVHDADPAAPPEDVVRQVRAIADAILRGSSRLQTRIHVFASPSWSEALRVETFDRHVRVHDLPAPSPSIGPEAARATGTGKLSSWTDWMSGALDGRSLDAVHFVTDAEMTLAGPALTLPVAERRSGVDASHEGLPRICACAEDVAAATTLLGAWATVVTPACGSRGTAANALVADAIARVKPGPLLYHTTSGADDAEALARAYALLLRPMPSRNVGLASGFIYSVPRRPDGLLPTPVAGLVGPLRGAITRNAAAFTARAPFVERWMTTLTGYLPGIPNHQIEQVPNWASAIQRYVETASLDQLRRASNDVLLSRANEASDGDAPASPSRQTEMVGKILTQIQTAVAGRIEPGPRPIGPPGPTPVAPVTMPDPRGPGRT